MGNQKIQIMVTLVSCDYAHWTLMGQVCPPSDYDGSTSWEIHRCYPILEHSAYLSWTITCNNLGSWIFWHEIASWTRWFDRKVFYLDLWLSKQTFLKFKFLKLLGWLKSYLMIMGKFSEDPNYGNTWFSWLRSLNPDGPDLSTLILRWVNLMTT